MDKKTLKLSFSSNLSQLLHCNPTLHCSFTQKINHKKFPSISSISSSHFTSHRKNFHQPNTGINRGTYNLIKSELTTTANFHNLKLVASAIRVELIAVADSSGPSTGAHPISLASKITSSTDMTRTRELTQPELNFRLTDFSLDLLWIPSVVSYSEVTILSPFQCTDYRAVLGSQSVSTLLFLPRYFLNGELLPVQKKKPETLTSLTTLSCGGFSSLSCSGASVCFCE